MRLSLFFGSLYLACTGSDGVACPSTTRGGGGGNIQVEVVAEGFTSPWGMAFLGSGEALVTEIPGRLKKIEIGRSIKQTVIDGLPVVVNLFDVEVHPQFDSNQTLYLSYAASDNEGMFLRVLRARLVDDSLRDQRIIFESRPKLASLTMSGARLLFLADGTLLVSVGDRSDNVSGAQDLRGHLGTVIRIRDDGTIPRDNPFADGGHSPEVYSFGHRNVQGMAFDALTDSVLAAEHGPIGGDELNLLHAGANYGWPAKTFGRFNGPEPTVTEAIAKYEPPIRSWDVALGPSSIAVYTGDRYADWQGSVFVTSLTQRRLFEMKRNGFVIETESHHLVNCGERLRNVEVGPDQALYVLTDALKGKILRITPKQNALVAE